MPDSDPDPFDIEGNDEPPVDLRGLPAWTTQDPALAGHLFRNHVGVWHRVIYVPPPLVDETDLNDIEGQHVDEATPWLENRGWTVHLKTQVPGLFVATNHTQHGHVLLVTSDAKVVSAVLNLG